MADKIWDPGTGFRAVRWLWEEWADGSARRAVAAGVAAGLASTLSPLFKAVLPDPFRPVTAWTSPGEK